MANSGLVTIGAFARASGLTASALRFYADSGLLAPAIVDPVSGYRYYAQAQRERAERIRELRAIGMPLETIARVLDAGADAARLIDEHVAGLEQRVQQIRERAAELEAVLGGHPGRAVASVSGPVFASAVEQILAATAHEPDHPVLSGVHVEVAGETLTLTATDRYRLSTRTLVLDRPSPADWVATVDGDDLRLAVPELRRRHRIRLDATPRSVRFRIAPEQVRTCRILPSPFPDHRLLLGSIETARVRVVVPRDALLRTLESLRTHHVLLCASNGAVTVAGPDRAARSPVPAVVTGPDMELAFDLTTFYPAIDTAIGPDVMIDISGPALPVVVRSADNGDLTTIAMPIATPDPTRPPIDFSDPEDPS
ncbi:DNA polymerase III subunit beta family protein [Nocardia veterana]|uniref:MerR family transcriptional regulator n=1 Tax=Nocardia veterana TaxID=132249 RepID=A0A7X6RH19_9NOCA|nr:MerR family transcriptional regulator [Nocardia veterana]NKY85069.1 MerR family transcriptional regulator [Nocardia veterana]